MGDSFVSCQYINNLALEPTSYLNGENSGSLPDTWGIYPRWEILMGTSNFFALLSTMHLCIGGPSPKKIDFVSHYACSRGVWQIGWFLCLMAYQPL